MRALLHTSHKRIPQQSTTRSCEMIKYSKMSSLGGILCKLRYVSRFQRERSTQHRQVRWSRNHLRFRWLCESGKVRRSWVRQQWTSMHSYHEDTARRALSSNTAWTHGGNRLGKRQRHRAAANNVRLATSQIQVQHGNSICQRYHMHRTLPELH